MTDFVADLPLVDHHCHALVAGDLSEQAVDDLLSEGGPAPAGMTNFDSPVGFAVRRHCAPVLGLDAFAPPGEYLRRRQELGAAEASRRLLTASGTGRLLVDTGFRGEELLALDEMARAAGEIPTHEIVRLEALAEQVAADGVEPEDFADTFAAALERRLQEPQVVGVKSIAAYRVGFDFDPARPTGQDVRTAASRWLAPKTGARPRLDDAVLTRHLLWCAVDAGRPIQFHVGFGDQDIRLHRANPALLTDFLHKVGTTAPPIMLLHCYPFHREASYLAAVYPQVHLDVGLTLTYVGPAAAPTVLAEALELGPFHKVLYSSDAFGLPELYLLGAAAFRRALGQLLTDRVSGYEWSAADAARVARWLAVENAERVYGLDTEH